MTELIDQCRGFNDDAVRCSDFWLLNIWYKKKEKMKVIEGQTMSCFARWVFSKIIFRRTFTRPGFGNDCF